MNSKILYRVKRGQDDPTLYCCSRDDVENRERERKSQIATNNSIGNHKEPVWHNRYIFWCQHRLHLFLYQFKILQKNDWLISYSRKHGKITIHGFESDEPCGKRESLTSCSHGYGASQSPKACNYSQNEVNYRYPFVDHPLSCYWSLWNLTSLNSYLHSSHLLRNLWVSVQGSFWGFKAS